MERREEIPRGTTRQAGAGAGATEAAHGRERLRHEAELAEENHWGKLYSELEQGCGPEGCPGSSEYDPTEYAKKQPEADAPDRYAVLAEEHEAAKDEAAKDEAAEPHVHVSAEAAAPASYFGGAGGWGHGGSG